MRLLVVFAHPDDETMLCGGTLALLAHLGVDVHYLSATRGEGGDLGTPPLCTRDQVGATREAELACAVSALGGSSLHFLDYIDPLVGENDTLYEFAGEDLFVAKTIYQELLDGFDMVLTHGTNGEYGHPAHKKVNRCVNQAVFMLPPGHRPLLYTFQGAFADHPKPHLMNRDDPAHIVLDIHEVADIKLAAIACHRTQHALFLRHAEPDQAGKTTLSQALVFLESLHRVYPPADQLPLDDRLTRLLTGVPGITLLERFSIPIESSPDHH